MHDAIAFLVERDTVFKELHVQYGNPLVPTRPEGFQTLVKLILEQQVSLESARACYVKIEMALGEVYPQLVLSASDEVLRACGVSRQKSSYLKNLAEAILNKELVLETLSEKHPDEVRNELIQIKGIGHWTIDVYLMFCLQSPDILPIGDIALVNTLKELYGCNDKAEMLALAENWKPYRSMATYFLWHHYLQKRNRKFIY
jgi:DNA-3-methyladenine glycosylase II